MLIRANKRTVICLNYVDLATELFDCAAVLLRCGTYLKNQNNVRYFEILLLLIAIIVIHCYKKLNKMQLQMSLTKNDVSMTPNVASVQNGEWYNI